MTKVIQVRGVPDDVHAKLVESAKRAGKSLNAFLVDQLEARVHRIDDMEHNRRVIEKSQAEFASLDLSRHDIRRAIDEARAERERELDERITRHRSA